MDLELGYKAEFGFLGKNEWYDLMDWFDDANLYQALSYDLVRYGRKCLAHMVLKKNGISVAAAQAVIIQVPAISIGIAYVRWGPMWRIKGSKEKTEIFRQAVRALRNEFSLKRRLMVRLYPLAYGGNNDQLREILIEEGYRPYDEQKVHRTLILDLAPTLDELRSAFDQKWRNCLNKAEKNELEMIFSTDEDLFDEVSKVYAQMAIRKGLTELNNINHLKKVQKDLPESKKLKVILTRRNGELCACGIFSTIGSTGVYLVGATTQSGMKTNGSYIVQWAFLNWLKKKGFGYYDLNGINPEGNPGTYRFKRGIAGKQGLDVRFIGKFQVSDNPLSTFAIEIGEGLQANYRRMVKGGRSLINHLNRLKNINNR
jgi:hypothetical protein